LMFHVAIENFWVMENESQAKTNAATRFAMIQKLSTENLDRQMARCHKISFMVSNH
jgi:hypothetical protein